jgi:WD40 repeat protein
VGRNPRSVQLWDLARVQQRARVFLDAAVSELAFTPDGASLLAASGDGSVRVWEARTGEERARMRHGTWLLAMALAPDGGRLAAASPQLDSAVVWDVPTRTG